MTTSYRRLSTRLLIYIILVVFALLSLYPIFFALNSSLKNDYEYTNDKLALPSSPTLDQYESVLINYRMLRYMGNTILSVSIGTLLYMLICSFAGFAFGQLRFRGRLLVFTLVLFLQIFPQMVIASQVYQIASKLGLLNTRTGIILVWCAYFAPFGTYIMTTYFVGIPRELLEAARIDGAGLFRQLFSVMLPVAKPMLGTIGIIGALGMWNELPFALLFLQKQELRTLIQGIALMQGEYGLTVPTMSAAVLVSAFIPLSLFVVFQNHVTMGATAGSVKG